MQFDEAKNASRFEPTSKIKELLTAAGIDPDLALSSPRALSQFADYDRLEGEYFEAIAVSEYTNALSLLEEYILKRFELFARHCESAFLTAPSEKMKDLKAYEGLLRWGKSNWVEHAAASLRSLPEDERKKKMARIRLRLTSRESLFLAEAAKQFAGASTDGIQSSGRAADDLTISGKNALLQGPSVLPALHRPPLQVEDSRSRLDSATKRYEESFNLYQESVARENSRPALHPPAASLRPIESPAPIPQVAALEHAEPARVEERSVDKRDNPSPDDWFWYGKFKIAGVLKKSTGLLSKAKSDVEKLADWLDDKKIKLPKKVQWSERSWAESIQNGKHKNIAEWGYRKSSRCVEWRRTHQNEQMPKGKKA